jgi:hypothetical protein
MSTAKIIMLPVIALTSSLMALPAADAAENDDSHSHHFANVHRDTATSRHCLPGSATLGSRPVSASLTVPDDDEGGSWQSLLKNPLDDMSR